MTQFSLDPSSFCLPPRLDIVPFEGDAGESYPQHRRKYSRTMPTSDEIQVLSKELQGPDADDITMKVAPVSAAPATVLPTVNASETKLRTSLEGVSLAYLSRFVLPYEDSYERMQPWTSKDINYL